MRTSKVKSRSSIGKATSPLMASITDAGQQQPQPPNATGAALIPDQFLANSCATETSTDQENTTVQIDIPTMRQIVYKSSLRSSCSSSVASTAIATKEKISGGATPSHTFLLFEMPLKTLRSSSHPPSLLDSPVQMARLITKLVVVTLLLALSVLIFYFLCADIWSTEEHNQSTTNAFGTPEPSTTSHTRNLPRGEPQQGFPDESFMRKLNKLALKVHLNLTEAKQYCTPNTSLLNCQIDWPKIASNHNVTSLNVSTGSNGTIRHDRCFTIRDEVTCFHQYNATHIEVYLTGLLYRPGTLDLEAQEGNTYLARHLLALGPEDFLLITGDKPDQFCFLTLLVHYCMPYQELISTNNQ